MISFSTYIGEHIVLSTKFFSSPEELSGIRTNDSKVFKYRNQFVIVRALNEDDLKDEDFVPWLDSMWVHNETNIKLFLRHRKEIRDKR